MKLPPSLITVTPFSKLIALFLFILFPLFGILIGIQYQKMADQNKPQVTAPPVFITQEEKAPMVYKGDYEVVVKESAKDKSHSDVYLKSKSTGEETLFITLPDVYRDHYHSSEFHNGNVYIIKRTGYEGYQRNPKWTDELWRFDSNKQGQQLFSAQGLDFRVSADEKYIAIITNEKFTMLDHEGKTIKALDGTQVLVSQDHSPSFGFAVWGTDAIWLDNTLGPVPVGIVKVDLKSFEITKYDISTLSIGVERALNSDKMKLAFTNYPALFDVDSAQRYEQSKAKVNLVVYDLTTKTQDQVATSITKRFNPVWISENTLEYDNSQGEGRVTRQY